MSITTDFAPYFHFSSTKRVISFFFSVCLLLTATSTVALPTMFRETISVSGKERILVYGDSLSAGYGIDPKDGWVMLLAKKMSATGVEVTNASISGETTQGGASRIKTDLARTKPTVVVVALGANDGLRGLPIAEMYKNLTSIILESKNAKARVILVGIQIPPNYGLDYAQQFRTMYPALAAKHHVPLVPFLLDGIADNLDLFQADHLHPKAEAQPRILENVLPTITRTLRIPPKRTSNKA